MGGGRRRESGRPASTCDSPGGEGGSGRPASTCDSPETLRVLWEGAWPPASCKYSPLHASELSPFCSQWFQSTVSKDDSMPEALKSLIFPNFEPLHKFHTNFLKEIEQRLALW